MLPAIPLCLEWLDFPVNPRTNRNDEDRKAGNFVAIGTMEPDIEIWDLDVVDSMYPNAILGQGGQNPADDGSKKKKKKQMKKKINDEYHIDAVLALAANRQHRNLLASGSADTTIKLWDLNSTKCVKSFNDLHTDKVCALDWHPTSPTILLSGSYDQTVVAGDLRAADVKTASARWTVSSDVEAVRWDPHDPNYFYVTTDNGMVAYYDVRGAATKKFSPVWMLQAHDDSISAFAVNPQIPGFIATGSTDKTVKLWHISSS
ncbi:rRNA-processing protein, partial [Ascosphaera atra]